MSQSWTCSLCARLSASSFCTCTRPETFLCQACFPLHLEKFPDCFHPTLPVIAYGHHRKVGYFERFNPRLEALRDGKEGLLRQIALIEQCTEELKKEVNQVVRVVWEYAERKVGELKRIRDELERLVEDAIAEAERTIYEENPKIENELAHQLRSKDGVVPIFQYNILVLKQPLIALTYTTFTNSLYLPQISMGSVKRYNMKTGEAIVSTISCSFTELTVYCPVSPDSILCVGGHPSVTNVFELSLSSWKLNQKQGLNVGRGLPGIVKCEERVFVFGGIGGDSYENLSSCEKLQQIDGPWTAIADMQYAKSCFFPCSCNGKLYLPVPNQPLEVFDIATETFFVCPVLFTIPGFEPSHDGLVAFLVDGEIVAVTAKEKIGRWRVGEGGEFSVSDGVLNNSSSAVSNIPPMRFGKEMFWVNYWTGAVVKFDVDRMEVTD